MSHKNLDRNGRWRNTTIAFHVSPEEKQDIEMRVKLSGLTKREYMCQRAMERAVVVMGNPRVYKALKTQMAEILDELRRVESAGQIDMSLHETIRIVAATVGGLRETDGKEHL